MGAHVVNMESAPFYAAAAVCGLRAIWIGHVGDVLTGDWQSWHIDRTAMNQATVENCLALLRGLGAAG